MKSVYLILILIFIPMISAESYFYAGSGIIASKTGTTINYLYHDRQGTESETKTLPFGQIIHSGNRFGYTGKETDGNELSYYGARYYDASIGRFTRTDPIRSNEAYSYAKNNPLKYYDPDGLKPVDVEGPLRGSTIILGTREGKEEYINLGRTMIERIPDQIKAEGITDIKEIVIGRFQLYRMVDEDSEQFIEISGKTLGEKMSTFLSPGAHIIMGYDKHQGRQGQLENFINEFLKENPSASITLTEGKHIPAIDDEGSWLRKYEKLDGLYRTQAVTSIAEWDSVMATGGIVQVKRYNDNNGNHNPNLYFSKDFIGIPELGKGTFIGSDQWRYRDFIDPDYRSQFFRGDVIGLFPGTDLDDPTLTRIDGRITRYLDNHPQPAQ